MTVGYGDLLFNVRITVAAAGAWFKRSCHLSL